MAKVALTVDADDAALDAIVAEVPLDLLQLHGSETPDRIGAVRARYGLPVIKVVGVATAADLAGLGPYLQVADQILLDAKPPPGAVLPVATVCVRLAIAGGAAVSQTLDARRRADPRQRGRSHRPDRRPQVDVASGVESAPGVKDAGLIAAFAQAVSGASQIAHRQPEP